MTASLVQDALRGTPLHQARLVDFHVHLGKWGLMNVPVSDDALIAKMDRVGVERICVNGILYPDVIEANNRVAAFARRHPARVVPFASLNPFQTDMVDELKRCLFELGCKGIKLHVAVAGGNGRHPLANPRDYGKQWEPVFAMAAEHRLPVLFHGIVTEDDIRRFPQTIFVQAHGLCGLQGESAKRRMAGYPNFYVDTAMTQNTVWECAETIRILGPGRILWGTDAPFDDFAQRLGIILDQPLAEAEKRAILGDNAVRLLRLDP